MYNQQTLPMYMCTSFVNARAWASGDVPPRPTEFGMPAYLL